MALFLFLLTWAGLSLTICGGWVLVASLFRLRRQPASVVRSVGTGPFVVDLAGKPCGVRPSGGSVRAAIQIAPDRDTLYREAGELAAMGAFDAAADLVIAASTIPEEK